MQCYQCNNEIASNANFCSSCGVRVPTHEEEQPKQITPVNLKDLNRLELIEIIERTSQFEASILNATNDEVLQSIVTSVIQNCESLTLQKVLRLAELISEYDSDYLNSLEAPDLVQLIKSTIHIEHTPPTPQS